MFTYTSRELKLLAICFALLILLIYNLVLFPIINSFLNFNETKKYSNTVYSKTIPINQLNSNLINLNTIPIQNNLNQNTKIISKLINKESTQQINETKNNEENTNNSNVNNTVKQVSNTNNQLDIIENNKNIKWRIQIPKINLDVHIMEGTSSDILLKSVGHFEETSKWNGNIGLAAHNRGYQCNFFAKIKNLEIGDEIIYTTTNGKKVYKIQTNIVIKDTDWSYLKNTNENKITLITCEENRESYRRCVQAIEIANYKL